MGYWRYLAEEMSKYQASEKQVLRIFYLWPLHISELHGTISVCMTRQCKQCLEEQRELSV